MNADNLENLVLEHLIALRTGQDRIENELREIKEDRLSAVETGLNGIKGDLVALASETETEFSHLLQIPFHCCPAETIRHYRPDVPEGDAMDTR